MSKVNKAGVIPFASMFSFILENSPFSVPWYEYPPWSPVIAIIVSGFCDKMRSMEDCNIFEASV